MPKLWARSAHWMIHTAFVALHKNLVSHTQSRSEDKANWPVVCVYWSHCRLQTSSVVLQVNFELQLHWFTVFVVNPELSRRAVQLIRHFYTVLFQMNFVSQLQTCTEPEAKTVA